MESVQLTQWGEVTSENYNEIVENNKKYYQNRITLFKIIINLMEDNDIPYFIDCGTLLGAFRNNKMIPHDNDLDMSVYGIETFKKIGEILKESLPNEYKVSENTTYSRKYMITKKEDDIIHFGGDAGDIEATACDIYLYTDFPNDKDSLRFEYHKFDMEKVKYSKSNLLPLQKINFENVIVNCPNNPLQHLKSMYGYIGKDAKYDKKTNLYVKL